MIRYLRDNVGDRNGLVILTVYELAGRGWIERRNVLDICFQTNSTKVAKPVMDGLEKGGLIEAKLAENGVNGGSVLMRLTAAGVATIREAFRATKEVTR